MSKYEIMYIIKANLENDQIKTIVAEMNQILTASKAVIIDCKEWGIKDMAYEIEHNRKGYYVLEHVEATKEAVSEFNRRANINENIIRHIVIKQ